MLTSVFASTVFPGIDLAEDAGVLIEPSSPSWVPGVVIAAVVVGFLGMIISSFSKGDSSLVFSFIFPFLISGTIFLIVGFFFKASSPSHVHKMNQIEHEYDVTFRTAEGDPWTDSDSHMFFLGGDTTAVAFTHGDSELQAGFLMTHPEEEPEGRRYVLVTGVDGLEEFSSEDAQ